MTTELNVKANTNKLFAHFVREKAIKLARAVDAKTIEDYKVLRFQIYTKDIQKLFDFDDINHFKEDFANEIETVFASMERNCVNKDCNMGKVKYSDFVFYDDNYCLATIYLCEIMNATEYIN